MFFFKKKQILEINIDDLYRECSRGINDLEDKRDLFEIEYLRSLEENFNASFINRNKQKIFLFNKELKEIFSKLELLEKVPRLYPPHFSLIKDKYILCSHLQHDIYKFQGKLDEASKIIDDLIEKTENKEPTNEELKLAPLNWRYAESHKRKYATLLFKLQQYRNFHTTVCEGNVKFLPYYINKPTDFNGYLLIWKKDLLTACFNFKLYSCRFGNFNEINIKEVDNLEDSLSNFSPEFSPEYQRQIDSLLVDYSYKKLQELENLYENTCEDVFSKAQDYYKKAYNHSLSDEKMVLLILNNISLYLERSSLDYFSDIVFDSVLPLINRIFELYGPLKVGYYQLAFAYSQLGFSPLFNYINQFNPTGIYMPTLRKLSQPLSHSVIQDMIRHYLALRKMLFSPNVNRHSLIDFPCYLIPEVGEPNEQNFEKGYYLYRNGTPEKIYTLVKAGRFGFEKFCLTDIKDFEDLLSALEWPTEGQNKEVTTSKELINLIKQHCPPIPLHNLEKFDQSMFLELDDRGKRKILLRFSADAHDSGNCLIEKKFIGKNAEKKAAYELDLLRKVQPCEHFVRLKSFTLTSVILTYYRTNLQYVMNQKKEFSLKAIQKILIDLLSGLKYLHKIGFVHLDIKPANLLVEGDIYDGGSIKFSDTGSAQPISTFLDRPVGAKEYMSPEVAELEHYPIPLKTSPLQDLNSTSNLAYNLIWHPDVPKTGFCSVLKPLSFPDRENRLVDLNKHSLWSYRNRNPVLRGEGCRLIIFEDGQIDQNRKLRCSHKLVYKIEEKKFRWSLYRLKNKEFEPMDINSIDAFNDLLKNQLPDKETLKKLENKITKVEGGVLTATRDLLFSMRENPLDGHVISTAYAS